MDENQTTPQEGGLAAIPPAGPVVKPAASKSGLNLSGPVAMDPTNSASVLEAMQRMIEQRTNPINILTNTIADMNAFAAPRTQVNDALRQRAQQRASEQKELFDMQSNIATLRSAQKQAENQGAMISNILGGGGNAPAGGGGAAPQGGGQLTPPPEVERAMQVMVAQGDRKGALDIYNKWLAGRTEGQTKFEFNPDAQKQVPYFIESEGRSIDMTPAQYMQYQRTGKLPGAQAPAAAPGMSGPAPAGAPAAAPSAPAQAGRTNQFNVGNLRPVGQSTGFQQPGSYEEGLKAMDQNLQIYGSKHGINTIRGIVSRWAPANENDTNNYIKFVSQKVGISPDQQVDLSNPVHRQLIGSAMIQMEKGINNLFPAGGQAPATAPGSSPTAAQGPRPKNMAEEKVQREIAQKRAEAQIEAEKSGTAEEHKEAATFITNLGKESSHAVEMKEAADRVINIVKKNPDIVGWRTKSDVPSMVLNAVSGVPGLGESTAQAAENIYSAGKGMLSGKDVGGMRNQLKTDADKLGLYTAGQMFAGNKNLGIGLEKLVANSKGVGPDASAKTNLINATIIKNGAERSIAINDGWRTFKDANPNATAMDYVRSPAFKQIDSTYEKAVRRDLVDLMGESEVNKYIGGPHNKSNDGRPSLSNFGSRKGN